MILVRLALITARQIPDRWRETRMEIDGMRLTPADCAEREREQSLMVYGELGLKHRPKITETQLIMIPKPERSKLEGALERYANVLAVSEGMKRKMSSPSPCVALVSEDDGDRQLLASASGILREGDSAVPDIGRTLDYASNPDAIADRLDGVALLAEALSQDHAGGRFRDLVKVFERAFRQSGATLRYSLSRFLDGTIFDYAEDEVEHWIRIRNCVSHADRRSQVLLEKDVAWLVHRVEQAAYDVLLNKMTWRNKNTDRRFIWTPVAGTMSSNGDRFITQGQATTLLYHVYDPFRCFPLDLKVDLNAYPETWWTGPFHRKDWREHPEPGAHAPPKP
jgi:hypothetical protein